MKRVVLIFTLFLFTLSNAFHPESLDLTTRILNHYHHNLDHDHQLQNNPSSDGSDSSNTLIPTETSTVPDHTGSYEIEFKEAVSTPDDTPEKVNPVKMKNRIYFPVYRFNPVNCRHINRFVRHPNRIAGFDSVISYVLKSSDVARKFPRHHHDDDHHHHDIDHDDEDEDDEHEVEIENDMVKKRKEKHHHHDHDEHDDDRKRRLVKDVLKKMRKEKHDDDDDEHDDHNDNKKRKVKLVLKKKRHEKHDDDHDEHDEHDDDKVELKDVMKKIRKFMNFF